MAKKGGSGGMVLPYGVVIDRALKSKGVSIEELLLLREQANAALEAQGNLAASLKVLDAEIKQRGGSGKAVEPQSFLLHFAGIDLSQDAFIRIEKRLTEAALQELGKLDLKGDLVTSPLSDVRAWGLGEGGHTGGKWIEMKLA